MGSSHGRARQTDGINEGPIRLHNLTRNPPDAFNEDWREPPKTRFLMAVDVELTDAKNHLQHFRQCESAIALVDPVLEVDTVRARNVVQVDQSLGPLMYRNLHRLMQGVVHV
jgi:hypothetical protein